MKQIKNITAAEILKQIKLTVICGEEITETNVCDGFSTWMEQFDASNPYEAFTPESREYFQNKLFVAFAAGMLPAEVTETRTNEVGPDGCWVFTVETSGTLNPYEETEETTAPAEEQTTATTDATTDTDTTNATTATEYSRPAYNWTEADRDGDSMTEAATVGASTPRTLVAG